MLVSYSGVEFKIVKTGLFHREPVMSEDGTEFLFMRTVFDLTMVYSPHAVSYLDIPGVGAVAAPGSKPPETDEAIRWTLMQPRRSFHLRADDGTTVLLAPVAGSDRDADNGPKPLACNVVAISPATWRVQWRVQVASIECGETSDSIPPILSNRWSQTQETSLDCLTRTTTRGVTVFRADALAKLNRTADYYRSQCIPGLPLGFQRQAISVNVSPAGNVLSWQVVDQEQFVSIGGTDDPRRGGVQSFQASFAMSSSPTDKDGKPTTFAIGQFDGYAKGVKTSSRAGLYSWLARLAIERCAIPNGRIDPETTPMILRVTASEQIHEPAVELHVTLQFPPAKVARQGFGPLRTDFLGVDVIALFANDGKSPNMAGDNNTRGTTDAALFAAAIKSACEVPQLPSEIPTVDGQPGDDYGYARVPQVEVGVTPVPSNLTRYSEDATSSGVYTEMSVEAEWKTDTGKMAVPLAGSPGEQDYIPGNPESGGGDEPGFAVLTLSRPTTTVEYTFEAERASTPPIIPDPNVNDPNLVLLHEHLSPMAVGLAPDGQTPVYRIGGVYKYAAKIARRPGTPLPFGVHPWTRFHFNAVEAVFPITNFAHGIIDAVTGSVGPTPIGPDS